MKQKSTHHFDANFKTKSKAKFLRRNQTPAEAKFWHMVRDKKIGGLKFRRQHPLGRFVVDFYCHELLLVVELDGNIHERKSVKMRDEIREQKIKELGLKVLRFSNEDVYFNLDLIADKIIAFKENGPSPVTP